MTTLVVGLGNPLLGDDGVGWRVVDELARVIAGAPDQLATGPINPQTVELEQLSVGGLTLMERLVGYERAILVDALASPDVRVGEVTCRLLDDLPDPTAGHLGSAHDTSLHTALATGRSLGAQLPGEVWVVSVGARRVYDFGDELSAPVAAAVPRAVAALAALLAARPREATAHA